MERLKALLALKNHIVAGGLKRAMWHNSMQRDLQTVKFMEDFSKFVNWSSRSDHDIAAKLFLKEHKTLQQNMIRFCMVLIENQAKNDNIDLRNKDSKEICQQITDLIGEISLSMI